MRKNETTLDTYSKAHAFNMDDAPYGTIAEIGAGQETSRWFFKVGGAAATIAKTMSAYDMKFSDSIYGPCKRYVSWYNHPMHCTKKRYWSNVAVSGHQHY